MTLRILARVTLRIKVDEVKYNTDAHRCTKKMNDIQLQFLS